MVGMKRDRRATRGLIDDRRRSGRIPDYRAVEWRHETDRQLHQGIFVEWSAHGMAMLTEGIDTPKVGSRIAPQKRPDLRGWVQPALVKRVDELPGGMQLVVGEYVKIPVGESSPITRRQVDRRNGGRKGLGRRRSPRWAVNRVLSWCVHRGRKIREARVIERSLDGLVLLADRDDSLRVGTRLTPSSVDQRQRFGFRSAVIRRMQPLNEQAAVLIAEIEA
jgi:hypothetical protein